MEMLIDPGIKRTCPKCANEFYPGDCRIMSQLSGKELKPAPKGFLEKQRARRYPEPLVGDKYVNELAYRECPSCQYHLPYNIESVDSKSIVIVGDTYSGKSHFIAALIRQIQDGQIYNPNQSMRFVCLTTSVLQTYTQNYINKLFKGKEVLDATQPSTLHASTDPLIYELIVKKSPAHPARKTNLIFYDAAGEDFASQERLIQYSRYVFDAAGIIFLADPISMPDILDRLPPHLQNQPLTGRRASDVLNIIIQLLERKRGLEPGSRLIRTPVAVTLSKSDLLKYLRGMNDPYKFLTGPQGGYSGGVDLQDLADINAEVRQLIHDFGDRSLLQATSPLRAQFFASSATGHSPKPDGTYPAVEPRRCLDPVLWVLNQVGVIDAK